MRLAQREPALTRLRTGIRHLFPGYFALVMATGIVSTAVAADGAASLSAAMLVLGIVCYLVLIACYIWRFASYRAEFVADATGPRTAAASHLSAAGRWRSGRHGGNLAVWGSSLRKAAAIHPRHAHPVEGTASWLHDPK